MALIPQRSGGSPEEQARTARNLVRGCGLTEADVDRILDYQRTDELSFAEAALRLGMVDQSDIDVAMGKPEPAQSEADGVAAAELLSVHDPYHSYTEKLRGLRQEILARRKSDHENQLAIVSAQQGDGRSRLAAEMAVVFAQMKQPTLLVDADLRHPRQHELFGLDNEVGLAQALQDGATPRVHGVQGVDDLFVLSSGERQGNPMELITGSAFGELLQGFGRRFKHVIVDTPDAGRYSDALAVASHCGSVLMAVREHHTPLAASRELVRRVNTTGAAILGVALLRA